MSADKFEEWAEGLDDLYLSVAHDAYLAGRKAALEEAAKVFSDSRPFLNDYDEVKCHTAIRAIIDKP